MNRRTFLAASALGAIGSRLSAAEGPIRVLVWDERQPAQKEAYPDFLGNAIAGHLGSKPGLAVKSAWIGDPKQGLSDLDEADVLIWWGHQRHGEISAGTGRAIVERIKAGKLSLVALHSAHWSTPFKEAMYERSRIDARRAIPEADRGKPLAYKEVVPQPFVAPGRSDAMTPSSKVVRQENGLIVLDIKLPNCCFPAYRGDGLPSHVRILKPDHPLAKGLPARFDIPKTEMYDDPFHVPPADEVVFEETWDKGEKFRSGLVWNLGKGKVVYFRPGHETYPVYRQAEPLQILENAARWLGESKAK